MRRRLALIRSDREIVDPGEMEMILDEGIVCHLGLCREGVPYVVPMVFCREDRKLFFHSFRRGLKLDFIEAGNPVCFEVETDVSLQPADDAWDWSMSYRSVIGRGRIRRVEGASDKLAAMRLLMKKYSGEWQWEIPEEHLDRTLVLCLDIETMTGKATLKQPPE